MNKHLYTFFLIFISSLINCQAQLTEKDLAPYTSQTSAIPKSYDFVNYSNEGEVDFATGKFGISIDLFNIKTPYEDFPINLKYSTSGVKVNENSNEVGIGWDLIAGGEITRIVNDIPDDIRYPLLPMFGFTQSNINFSNDFLPPDYHSYNVRNLFSTVPHNGLGYINASRGSSYANFFPNPHIPGVPKNEIGNLAELMKYSIWQEEFLPTMNIDTEPDVFHFSVGKKVFSFILKPIDQIFSDGTLMEKTSDYFEAVPLNELGVKIEFKTDLVDFYNYNKYNSTFYDSKERIITEFIITDTKGIKYIFDKYEIFHQDVLKEIKLNHSTGINGKRIVQYKYYRPTVNKWKISKIVLPNSQIISYSYIKDNYKYQTGITRDHYGEYKGKNYNLFPMLTPYGLRKLDYELDGYAVSEISYQNTKIKFNYSTSRSDRRDLHSGGLSLNEISIWNKNSKIKGFKLNKEYSYSDYDVGGQHEEKRMFLSSINDSTLKNPFIFEYDRIDHLAPKGFDEYQDIFGYNLGMQINQHPAFPTCYLVKNVNNSYDILYDIPAGTNYITINGADRSVKSDAVKAGTLNYITFPTKGKLKIVYESNTYSQFQLLNRKALGPGVRVAELHYLSANNDVLKSKKYNYNNFTNSNYSSGTLIYKPSFAHISNYALDNEFDMRIPYENNSYDFFSLAGSLEMYRMWYRYYYYSAEEWKRLGKSENDIIKKMVHLSTKPKGETVDYLGRSIVYENVAEEIIDTKGSGKKILNKYYFKISDIEPNVNSISGPSDEEFDYEKGKKETFIGESYAPFFNNDLLKSSFGYIARKGKGIYPFPKVNTFGDKEERLFGKLIKKEIYNDSQKILTEDYFYDVIKLPSINSNILRGLKTNYLKGHLYYEKNASKSQMKFEFKFLSGYPISAADYYTYHGLYLFSFNIHYYNSKLELIKMTQTHHFPTQNYILSTDYKYNRSGSLIEKSTTNSSDEKLLETYSYPYKDADYDWLNFMHSRNMISFPYKKSLSMNGKLTDETEYDYKIFETPILGAPNITLRNAYLSKVKTFKVPNPSFGRPQEVIEYLKYDENGNPIEYRLNSEKYAVMIYGYDGTLPIAKIENIRYEDIDPLLISQLQFNSNQGESVFLTALNTFRNNPIFKNAFVTTYTHYPLIGISTITESNGMTKKYIYNEQRQLEAILDNNGNIIKRYDYNFK